MDHVRIPSASRKETQAETQSGFLKNLIPTCTHQKVGSGGPRETFKFYEFGALECLHSKNKPLALVPRILKKIDEAVIF